MRTSTKIFYPVMLILFFASIFFDNAVVNYMQGMQTPLVMDAAAWLGHLGSIAVVLIAMTSMYLWTEKKREWIPALWGSVIITFITVHITKFFVMRPRPLGIVQTIPLFGWVDYSFPSGHAAVAFSTIAILDREFPKLKWFWILFAIAVSFSRLYQNLHYLSDVMFGIMLGYTFGLWFRDLEEKYRVFEKVKIWRTSSR